MSIGTDVARIKGNITAALAAIADKGVTVPDGSTSDALAGLITSIEAGGGTSIEPVKAFCSYPLTNEIYTKNVVPVIAVDLTASAYTNTSETIGVSFTFGGAGTTYVLALAVRNPSAEPALPVGWEKCAWIEPHTNATTKQYLLVLKHTVTSDETGTTCNITFYVTQGQRHYIAVVSVGDSEISANDVIVNAYSGITEFSTELYEHTILICSSTLTLTSTSSYKVWALNDGYNQRIMPKYSDNNSSGGRLGILYIPHLTEQPFVKPNIQVYDTGNASDNVLICALRLIPGTSSKCVALI